MSSKRPRGAPSGNLNALKHGFYSRRFKRRDARDLEGHDFHGLADEITMMRVFLRDVVERYDEAGTLAETVDLLRAVCLAATSLTRLVKTHQLIAGNAEHNRLVQDFYRALDEIYKDLPIAQDPDGNDLPP